MSSGDVVRIEKARHEWELTDEGLQELEKQGKGFEAALRRAERAEIETVVRDSKNVRLAESTTDPAVLDRLARDITGGDDLARAVVNNPVVSQGTLASYAEDGDVVVREVVARKSTDRRVLNFLLEDPDRLVRDAASDRLRSSDFVTD